MVQRIDFEQTATLVEGVQKGDDNAFDQLYHLYFQHVYFMALKVMGDRQDAIEATQDAFEAAYRNIQNLKTPRAFQRWMSKITYTTCLGLLKNKNRGGKFLSSEDLDIVQEHVFENDEEIIPESYLQNRESQQVVSQLIDNLPEAQRASLVLHYFEGYSPAEISKITGAKANVIYKRLSDAKNTLKKQLLALSSGEKMAFGVGAVPALTTILHNEAVYSATPEIEKIIHTNLVAALGLTLTATGAQAASVGASTSKGATKGLSNVQKGLVAATVAASVIAGAVLISHYSQVPDAPPAAPATSKKDDTDIPSDSSPEASGSTETSTPASPAEATNLPIENPPATAPPETPKAQSAPQDPEKPAAVSPEPEKKPVLVPPTITVARPDLSYPSGRVVSAAQILSDAGVVAKDSSGKELTPQVSRYDNIDFSQPGSYILAINATDSKGTPAASRVIMITLIGDDR